MQNLSPKDLSPKAEPIAWANAAALIVAALVGYGVPINDPLAELLGMALPFVLANLWARFQVWAPDTHAAEIEQAAALAREEGRIAGVRSASNDIRTGPGTFKPHQAESRFRR